MAEKGKTVGEWLVEQAKGEAGNARKVKLRMLDALGVLALLLFNLAMLVGFGWIVEQRFVEIVNKLPEYRQGIQAKFHRVMRSGGVLEKAREEFRQTVQEVPTTRAAAATMATTQTAVAGGVAPGAAAALDLGKPLAVVSPAPLILPSPDEPWAVRLYPKPASALELLGQYLGKLLSPVATAAQCTGAGSGSAFARRRPAAARGAAQRGARVSAR